MASDRKHLLFVNERLAEKLSAEFEVDVPVGTWLQVNALPNPKSYSRKFQTTYVLWAISTVVESVSIDAWVAGKCVRTLSFHTDGDAFDSTNRASWHVDGEALPFEDSAQIGRWLKRARVRASTDGYDVLEAFLGGPWDEVSELADHADDFIEETPPPKKSDDLARFKAALRSRNWAAARKLMKAWQCAQYAEDVFERAIKNGSNLKLARDIVKAGLDPNAIEHGTGLTALHDTQDPKTIARLIQLGANVEAKDRLGYTPLLGLLSNVNPNSAAGLRALLKAGADPHATFKGMSAVAVLRKYVRGHRFAAKYAAELEEMLAKAQSIAAR